MSPWQIGVVERWLGSCRRDLLDQVIAFHERHWKRRFSEYVGYSQPYRTHLGLQKDTPGHRENAAGSGTCHIVCKSRLGGLHDGYDPAAEGSVRTTVRGGDEDAIN